MPTILWKNFLKCLPSTPLCFQHSFPLEQDHHPSPPSTTTTNDNNTTMVNNLNHNIDYSKSLSIAPFTDSSSSFFSSFTTTSSSDSDCDTKSPVDFAAILASQRFFFSSPGQSNSIIESSETLPPFLSPKSPLSGGLAVKKYSPNPYEDFKRSMQEMIDARKLNHMRVDWDYLHELLSCYLTLNPKHTHKFIISAFADIVVTLLSSSSPETDTLWLDQQCHQQHALQKKWSKAL